MELGGTSEKEMQKCPLSIPTSWVLKGDCFYFYLYWKNILSYFPPLIYAGEARDMIFCFI